MGPLKYIPYRSCTVPNCPNTTVKTPEKLFLCVPKDAEVRKKWCIAMNRDKSKSVTTLSPLFCCEDHFTLKDDLENYWQHKLLGNVKKLRLNKGVVPHKFHCQEALPKGEASVKCRKLEENVVQIYLAVSDPKPGPSALSFFADNTTAVKNLSEIVSKQSNKSIQVEPNYRGKGASKKPDQNTVSASTLKTVEQKLCVSLEEENVSTNEEICSESSSDYSIEEEEADIEFKSQMFKATLLAIDREPQLLIGIPKNTYYILRMLSAKSDLTTRDILITFKKIRLNESYAILALQFGTSICNVSRIFSKSVPVLANLIKELIVWMPKEKVQLHLPIPFRARYSNVQSIIDCFEIQIEKPTNLVHQAFTWSQYKECNTIKYLISCTPDGLINFISSGFDGRASDVTIVEECGFLEKLEPGSDVMADRGFKNMGNILQQKGCNLVRPPSEAFRTYVDSAIGRLRDYSILLPHAIVDSHLAKVIDDIIIIVCGLVNIH